LTALDQAKTNVQAATSGYHGTLRIALSDGLVSQRLAALLAVCREQEPDVDTRLFEIPLAQQIKGLRLAPAFLTKLRRLSVRYPDTDLPKPLLLHLCPIKPHIAALRVLAI
jgi:hypothetical protein